MSKPWFKGISQKHPAAVAVIDAFGWEGFGAFLAVIENCLELDVYTLDIPILCRWLRINSQRAKKYLPVFQENLEKVLRILGKVSTNCQKVERFPEKVSTFDASNPSPDYSLLEENRGEEKRIEKEKIQKEKKYTESHRKLAEEFWEVVHERFPYYNPPDFDEWSDVIRKINLIDGYTIDEIEDVAAWALTKSEFWGGQIRSPANLRKHWAKLLDQSGLYEQWERKRVPK